MNVIFFLQDVQRWNVFKEAIGQQECSIQCSSPTTTDISPLSLKRQRVALIPNLSQSGEISSLASSAADVSILNFPQVVVAEEKSNNIEAAIEYESKRVGNAQVVEGNDAQQEIHGADRNAQKHANSPTVLEGLLTRGE